MVPVFFGVGKPSPCRAASAVPEIRQFFDVLGKCVHEAVRRRLSSRRIAGELATRIVQILRNRVRHPTIRFALAIAVTDAAIADIRLPQRQAVFSEHLPKPGHCLFERLASHRVLRMECDVRGTVIDRNLHPERAQFRRRKPNLRVFQLIAGHHDNAFADLLTPC